MRSARSHSGGTAMDEQEYWHRDVELRRADFEQRERHHKSQRASVIWTGVITFLGVLATVIVATVTILRQSGQFDASLRAGEYSDIVSGLESDAVAVQDSSMRRLVAYVQDADNFDSEADQEAAFHNAMQTLTAFIVDESTRSGQAGLGAYQNPQPLIVPRAMGHLETLTEDEMGEVTIDIARADLHGANLPGFAPRTKVYAAGVDLRRADLTGLDLEADGSSSTLRSAFLTCASLVHAKLGNAAMDGADLTGADLRDADLSRVTGLTDDQLHGAWIGPLTVLPDTVNLGIQVGWRETDPQRCYTMVNSMTGMRGSQGYYAGLPCPESKKAAKALDVEPPWQGPRADLVEACQLRSVEDDEGQVK